MKNSMYVIFGYDRKEEKGKVPGSAILNGWGHGCVGPRDFFRASECFPSKNKAKSYIQKGLRDRRVTGGRLRPDINYANYEIRQVYKSKATKGYYLLSQEEARRGEI